MTVGFIGLGNLGAGMCRRLVALGFPVRIHDVSDRTCAEFAGLGAEVGASPSEVADGADVVCVVVRTDQQAEDVIIGDGGVLASQAPAGVVVLHSTVAPSTVGRLGDACDRAGVPFLDAGVSGGPERALTGDLVTVVGGTDAEFELAREVLDAYCSSVIHCGTRGSGMAAKLARNLGQYGVWCALFESMELAAGAGVDLGLYADYVRVSGLPTNHDVVLARGSVEPGTDDEAERARLEWAVDLGDKDLADAFELAEAFDVAVPIGKIARRRYARVMGLDARDA